MVDVLVPRETRPWPPRRVGQTLTGVTVLAALVLGVTAYLEHNAVAGPCRALGREVDGLGSLTWSDGMASAEGSWLVVMSTWHRSLGPEERIRASEAVRADDEGFAELRDAVRYDIRADVSRLHDRIVHPWNADVLQLDAMASARRLERYALDECGIAP